MTDFSIVKALVLWLFFLGIHTTIFAQKHIVTSPDKKISLEVTTEERINWSIRFEDKTIIENAVISMTMDNGRALGVNPKLRQAKVEARHEVFDPVIAHKDAHIESQFNELILDFKGSYQIIFRVYNDGAAYRFIDLNKKTKEVFQETMTLEFSEEAETYFPQEESIYSHNERIYLQKSISE